MACQRLARYACAMANTKLVWVSFVAYVLLLAGCAAPQSSRMKLGVPLVRQTEAREGGLASARMVTQFYKVALPARTEHMLRLASSSGELSAVELKAAIESSGLSVSVVSGTLEGASGLYAHLDRGEPVVVLLGSSYMLVDGYGGGSVRLLDPLRGVLVADAEDFELAWQDSSRTALAARR